MTIRHPLHVTPSEALCPTSLRSRLEHIPHIEPRELGLGYTSLDLRKLGYNHRELLVDARPGARETDAALTGTQLAILLQALVISHGTLAVHVTGFQGPRAKVAVSTITNVRKEA